MSEVGKSITLLPHCYDQGVTGVTAPVCKAGTPGLQAFQADERAVVEQLREGAAVGQAEIARYQFRQRVQHERPGMHVVMRHFQARLIEHLVAEQQDVQVQCARAPAFLAHAA